MTTIDPRKSNPKIWLTVGAVVAGVMVYGAMSESEIRAMWKRYYSGDAGVADPHGEQLNYLTNRAPSVLTGTATWVSPAIAGTNGVASTTVTVTGALPGYPAVVGFSAWNGLTNIVISGLSGTNTVAVTAQNVSVANLATNVGTLRATVFVQ